MVIRELITKFGFDVDESELKKMDEGIEKIQKGLFGLAALAGAATVALFGMVKVSANAADNITDTAKAVGVTTDALQELGYAALLSGSNMETMSTGLRFLSKNIADAAKDKSGDLAKEFKKIGVSVTDAHGRLRTADAVLLDVADAFTKIQDPARKVNLAMDLLGKSGTQLIQTLERGSKGIRSFGDELRASGAFLDEEALERLGAFNDAWDKLFGLFSGLRNSIASEIAPLLTEMIDTFREWMAVNGQILKQKIIEFLKAFAWWLKVLFTFAMRVGDIFVSLAKHIGGVEIVTKALLLVMTALSAASIIGGLLKIAPIFWGIAKAALAALAPFALVAAKIIAIGALIFLVVEDIYTFFTGGDSVTGLIVQAFIDMWSWIKKSFNSGMEWLHATLKGWADWFSVWFLNFTKPFTNFLTFLGDGLRDLVGPGMQIKTNIQNTGSLTGITPQTAPVGGANNNNSSLQVSAPITVTVPAGTDPGMVGDRVESGLQLGIGDLFRQTNRVTAPGVAY